MGKLVIGVFCVITVESVNDPFISRTDKRIIANVTSYEIVCATAL